PRRPRLSEIIPAQWESVNHPLSVKKQVRFNALSVQGHDPVTIVTPTEPWNYALGFPSAASDSEAKAISFHLAVLRVCAEVKQGRIGTLALETSSGHGLDETLQGKSQGLVPIDLLLRPGGKINWLMVRNGPEPGPSTATIHKVEVFQMLDDEKFRID